jgi:hypothetical protein
LRVRLSILFYQCEFNDADILFALQQEEFFIDIYDVVRIRKELDIIKRVSARDVKETDKRLLKIIQAKFDKDIARDYDRDMLYYHFRNQEHIISRSVLRTFNFIA